jgi:hypothetical protein
MKKVKVCLFQSKLSQHKQARDEIKSLHWSTNYTTIRRQDFSAELNSRDGTGWKAFETVRRNFTDNKTAGSYIEAVQQLISSHSAMGRNMSWKLHILHSPLDLFPENTGTASNEHGEGSIRLFPKMKRYITGEWSPDVLGDCRCIYIREIPRPAVTFCKVLIYRKSYPII